MGNFDKKKRPSQVVQTLADLRSGNQVNVRAVRGVKFSRFTSRGSIFADAVDIEIGSGGHDVPHPASTPSQQQVKKHDDLIRQQNVKARQWRETYVRFKPRNNVAVGRGARQWCAPAPVEPGSPR